MNQFTKGVPFSVHICPQMIYQLCTSAEGGPNIYPQMSNKDILYTYIDLFEKIAKLLGFKYLQPGNIGKDLYITKSASYFTMESIFLKT